jgi:ergothioneine biosynthesis protein EgtB
LSHTAAAIIDQPTAASSRDNASSRRKALAQRFHQVRDFTTDFCSGLAPEDCVVQSMPDVSPAKWHMAHTTWFFETFIVKRWVPGYRPEVPEYAYLFNSYYNAAGDMHRRDLRGLISRPTVEETRRYRASVDCHIDTLLTSADDDLLAELEPLLILGIHHEQQHQELMVTDIKHVFAQNPLHPIFRDQPPSQPNEKLRSIEFVEFDERIVEIGHAGPEFSYDNEGPRHRALVAPFALGSRLITNGEYLAFIDAGGYRRPEHWLSLGWTTVNEQRWDSPLYWAKHDGQWWNFTLSGFRQVNESEPVAHLSYFEADAYANWSGARLPTEFEWEYASQSCPLQGNFVEAETFHPLAESETRADRQLRQMFGDVWEWTRSAYSPYPGYRAIAGALGEYNGKFMCNQYVLRGGSCATSQTHIRRTYRNFFQPEKRWQFTGLRLAKDLS